MRGPVRLRLLLMIDEMEIGGSQRQLVTLARQLDPETFDVTAIYFRSRSHLVDELEKAGVRVVLLPKRSRVDLRFVSALRGYLAEHPFDVMHCFSFTAELWGALARASFKPSLRPALVTSIRGTYEWYSRAQWLLKRFVTQQSSAVVANSQAGADYAARRMRLARRRITLVYNGVGLPDRHPAAATAVRKELGLEPDSLLLLFVGRLVEHKDLPTLLKAMRRLCDEGLVVRLLIAGDGPLRDAVEQQIEALDIGPHVSMVGERGDVVRLMSASDLLVLPSLREGLSNVILEAMAAGLPVVASRAGGNVELIEDDVDGVLFDVGSSEQLATNVRRLSSDPGRRRRLAEAARFKVSTKFSVPAMADRLAALYEQVAKARGVPLAREAAA